MELWDLESNDIERFAFYLTLWPWKTTSSLICIVSKAQEIYDFGKEVHSLETRSELNFGPR